MKPVQNLIKPFSPRLEERYRVTYRNNRDISTYDEGRVTAIRKCFRDTCWYRPGGCIGAVINLDHQSGLCGINDGVNRIWEKIE